MPSPCALLERTCRKNIFYFFIQCCFLEGIKDLAWSNIIFLLVSSWIKLIFSILGNIIAKISDLNKCCANWRDRKRNIYCVSKNINRLIHNIFLRNDIIVHIMFFKPLLLLFFEKNCSESTHDYYLFFR